MLIMLISIVIPCYNAKDTIKNCLESLINQTYKNIEIICINDGSIDSTLETLKKYQKMDKRIKVINNKNHGVSYTRNCGIENATGDYITFIDSDDFIDIDTISIIVSKLKNVDILRYNFLVDKTINKYNNSLGKYSNKIVDIEKEKKDLYNTFFTMNNIPTLCWLLFIKRKVLKNIRFDTNLSFMEDSKFYFEILNSSKNIYFLDKKLYHYVISENGLTRNINRLHKNICDILYINTFFNENISDNNILRKINTSHLNMICRFLPQIYVNDKNKYNELYCDIKQDINFKRLLKDSNLKNMEIKKRMYAISMKYHINFMNKLILKISNKYLNRK